MNILIVANFTHNFDKGIVDGRFNYLAEVLVSRGHRVEIVTSDFDHDIKEYRKAPLQSAYAAKITYVHEPKYNSNVSIKRLWAHYKWGCNVSNYIKNNKPDIIYCAVPSLTAGVRCANYCKKNGIKFIIDVQDLWPEAFEMAINNPVINMAFIPIKWYVNHIYKSADIVVAVSDTYCERVLSVNKKTKKGVGVFLGNDGAIYENERAKAKNCSHESIYLAYIGTLSYSYDIPCVLKALDVFKQTNSTPVKFIIMGAGPLMEQFKDLAVQLGVDCEFTGRLAYEDMVARLLGCDIVINPITKGSAASIINKVGDYALSGLPVINTQESPEYRHLIEQYHCGINCKCGDADGVAKALKQLVGDKQLRELMGENARKLGEEKFDRRNSYLRIVSAIENTNKTK